VLSLNIVSQKSFVHAARKTGRENNVPVSPATLLLLKCVLTRGVLIALCREGCTGWAFETVGL